MRTSKNKNKEVPFRHITIIGVGLIGGSLGLAIKQRYPSIRITGVDRKEILKKALASGAIDHSTNSITKGVNGSELVILAQPIGVIQKSLPIMAQHISPTAIVTDVGSIKKSIVQEAEKYFPKGNLIGGHPMTGAETSGIQSAQSLLFENAVYVLTPVSNTLSKNVLRLAHFL